MRWAFLGLEHAGVSACHFPKTVHGEPRSALRARLGRRLSVLAARHPPGWTRKGQELHHWVALTRALWPSPPCLPFRSVWGPCWSRSGTLVTAAMLQFSTGTSAEGQDKCQVLAQRRRWPWCLGARARFLGTGPFLSVSSCPQCLAAGSIIMNRELESMAMRPLAKELTRSLEDVRGTLRDQALRDLSTYTEKMREALRHFDVLFAEFELR